LAKLEEKETEVENKEESVEEAVTGKSLNDAISAYRKISPVMSVRRAGMHTGHSE